MKNFGTLFYYELKKIWMRPLLWAALLGTMAASAFGVLPSALWSGAGGNLYVEYKDGRVVGGYVTEKEKLRIELEWAPKLNGTLLDEAFFRDLRNSLRELNLNETTATVRSDLEAYFLLVDPTYYGCYRYGSLNGDFQHITEQSYYDRSRALRQTEMASSWYGKLTEEEMDYWTRLGDQVQTPYAYSYYRGWSSINQALSNLLCLLLPLLVGICLCNVFSCERHRRTDALVFASRSGRFPLYLAKGLAGIVTIFALTALTVGSAVVTAGVVFGGGWFDAPIQLSTPTNWPITMGQALMVRLGLYLTYALLCGGLVLLVSLLTGSGVAGMTAAIAMSMHEIILPRYFIEANWLPGNILSPSVFLRYRLVELFGVQFNWVELDLALYTAAALVLLALCWLGWRRSAVGKA